MKPPKNILLIEDDSDDQETFIEALETLEDKPTCNIVNNGQEALDLLNKMISLPDIIFMDINMPMMNGIDCLKMIINNPRTKNIPVIMLSTSLEQKDLVYQLGAKAFLKKAGDAELLNQIRGIFDMLIPSGQITKELRNNLCN